MMEGKITIFPLHRSSKIGPKNKSYTSYAADEIRNGLVPKDNPIRSLLLVTHQHNELAIGALQDPHPAQYQESHRAKVRYERLAFQCLRGYRSSRNFPMFKHTQHGSRPSGEPKRKSGPHRKLCSSLESTKQSLSIFFPSFRFTYGFTESTHFGRTLFAGKREKTKQKRGQYHNKLLRLSCRCSAPCADLLHDWQGNLHRPHPPPPKL